MDSEPDLHTELGSGSKQKDPAPTSSAILVCELTAWEKGDGRQDTGEKRQDKGDERKETGEGERRREKGERRREKEDKRKE